MQYFARVVSGVVFEIVEIPDGAALADCFQPSFAALLTPCQSTVQQGWTYSGTAFAAPVPPSPTVQQQAAAMLLGPVMVQCAAVPAINGLYPLDTVTQARITSIAAAINAGFGLPGGGDTFNWSDTSGTMHAWPAAQFTEFAKASMDFVYAASQVAQGNGTALPSTTLTIN